MRKQILAIALAAVLAACASKSTTPSTPNPPQQTVVNLNQTFIDGVNLALNACISLNQSGKLNAANTDACKKWSTVAATASRNVAIEMQTADDWSTQRAKILAYLGTVTAPAVAGTIDPALATDFANVAKLVQQVIQAVQ